MKSEADLDGTIRRATIDDVEAISMLVTAAYEKWVPVIGRKPLPMTVDYAAAVRCHRIDLLIAGRDLVALIETVPSAAALLIENVAVDQRFQKRGFGRQMIAHAERLAREGGFQDVRLYTNARFEANLRLYAALGYTVDREEPFAGGTVVPMRKSVA